MLIRGIVENIEKGKEGISNPAVSQQEAEEEGFTEPRISGPA